MQPAGKDIEKAVVTLHNTPLKGKCTDFSSHNFHLKHELKVLSFASLNKNNSVAIYIFDVFKLNTKMIHAVYKMLVFAGKYLATNKL